MKNQYQLNMRMIYSISTQTLCLKRTIDQVKGSRCTLIIEIMVKCLLESDVSQFLHISVFRGIYSFMRYFVCNQINNGYCQYPDLTPHFYLSISSWIYTHLTNVSDDIF